MVIRCERCSTLYELDEALLSPAGSEVQCTKCQHVFLAHPPRSAGRTLVGMPVQPGAPAEPVRTAAAAGQREPTAPPRDEPAPLRRHDDPGPVRAARPAPPPVYRPSVPASPVRAPVLKRDTVGAFEARLRWHARWKWLGPSLAAALVVLAVAGVVALRRRGDANAARARADALALVALDDAASVEAGTARLEDEARRSPRGTAAGDRALAQVVRAAALVEEGEGLAARLAARSAERERLRRDQPDGWEEAELSVAADARTLEREVRQREEKARVLCRSALDALRALQRDAGDRVEVLRGLAAYYALGGERDRALKVVSSARDRGFADGWIDLAEAWTAARESDRTARERVLVKLGAVAAAHPELLRARFVLARTQAALGRRGEALATVDGLLAANPRHEGAKRLKAELLVAPEPGPTQAGNADIRPRNPVAQQAAPQVRDAETAGGVAGERAERAAPTSGPAARPLTPAPAPGTPPAVSTTGSGVPPPGTGPAASSPGRGDSGPGTGARQRARPAEPAPQAREGDISPLPAAQDGG